MWIDRRVLFAVAAASLLLNLFLGGTLLGRVLWQPRAENPPRGGGGLVPRAHVQALPPEDRRRFRQAMAPHRPTIRAAREAHRAVRRRIEADIAAPDYDQAKIIADFQALRESNRRTEEALDAALVDALSSLPAQSRAALVSHVRAPPAPHQQLQEQP